MRGGLIVTINPGLYIRYDDIAPVALHADKLRPRKYGRNLRKKKGIVGSLVAPESAIAPLFVPEVTV